jgi:LCP family protein required for cell wall assembly
VPGEPAVARSPAGFRVSYPAMQAAQGSQVRTRSAFTAAFLSLIFPGLGHVYAGAAMRGIAFAAVPLLAIALLLGVVTRVDRAELAGFLLRPSILDTIFVVNILLAGYRIAAVIDAWRVARFLNAADASGTGRLGRARLPLSPFSIAGVAAVLLVLLGGHAVVARFDSLAKNTVCAIYEGDEGGCDQPDPTAQPSRSVDPSDSFSPDPTEVIPTPIASSDGTPAPQVSIPPWDGQERLNILLVGSDQRPNEGTYNTDTLIVLSIDPVSGRVAMFQLPRDSADLPVPRKAQNLWGRTYGNKITSWLTANANRDEIWGGNNRRQTGFIALKAILGELYDLDIKYYVEVNFQGFRDAVDTLGGVNINVQTPLVDDRYPTEDRTMRRLYVPAGPQHMNGTQALAYARSRKTTDDFDRGRRQQRVLLSLREQADIARILANLDQLARDVGNSVRTDIPPSLYAKLLGLADTIDTRNVRSYVFAPSFYATQFLNSDIGYKIVPNVQRIRRAVANAFTGDPQIEERREELGGEGGRVWVLNGSGKAGQASTIANYLEYNGMDASAPNQRVETVPPDTRIVVYNGAESRLTATIAFLEKVFKVEVTVANDDDEVGVDIIVTTGRETPDLEAPAAG